MKKINKKLTNKSFNSMVEAVVKADPVEKTDNPDGTKDNNDSSLDKTSEKIEKTKAELKYLEDCLKDVDELSNKVFGNKNENIYNVKTVIKVSDLNSNNIKENKDWRKNKTRENLYSSGVKERMSYEIEEALINGNHPLSESDIFPESYNISSDASLIVKEFEYSVKKCHEAFGINEINNIKLYEDMGKLLKEIKDIEKPNRTKLVELAKKIIIDEFNIPEGAIEFECKLVDDLKPKTKKTSKVDADIVFENNEQISEAIYALDKKKGIYALAEGAVDNATTLYKNIDELVDINPQLSNNYNKIMYGAKYLNYVTNHDDDKVYGGDYSCEYKKNSNDTITPTIKVKAIAFPILVQEMYRGVMEVLSTHGIHENEIIAEYVLNNDDYVECQPWYSKFGPRIWKKFCGNIGNEDNNLKYEIFSKLVKKEPKEFLSSIKEIIGNTRKSKLIVDEIINEIKEEKIFEKYNNTVSNTYFDKDELI